MHVKEALVGTTIRCPDCTTENLVRPAKAAAVTKKPSLDEAIEFDLDAVAERPKYQPLVVPRGEDEILGQLGTIDTQAATLEGSLPAALGREPQPTPAAKPAKAPPPDDDDDDDDDFQLSAPIERPVYQPPPPRFVPDDAPPPPPPPAGIYGDELWGQTIDPNDPEGWKKSPFMVGLASFLLHADAIAPWVMQCVGAAGMLMLGQFVFGLLNAGGYSTAVGVPFLALLVIAGTLYGASLAACCLAVVQDTANGSNLVHSWPGINFIAWFFEGIYVLAAAFVATLPGMALAWLMLQQEGMPLLIAPLLAMCSGLVLFPIVLFSMLEAGSILTPISQAVIRSLQHSADGWLLFYMYSFGFGLLGGIGMTIADMPFFLATVVGAVILVTLTLLYFRVLGRLMWYCQKNHPAESEE